MRKAAALFLSWGSDVDPEQSPCMCDIQVPPTSAKNIQLELDSQLGDPYLLTTHQLSSTFSYNTKNSKQEIQRACQHVRNLCLPLVSVSHSSIDPEAPVDGGVPRQILPKY